MNFFYFNLSYNPHTHTQKTDLCDGNIISMHHLLYIFRMPPLVQFNVLLKLLFTILMNYRKMEIDFAFRETWINKQTKKDVKRKCMNRRKTWFKLNFFYKYSYSTMSTVISNNDMPKILPEEVICFAFLMVNYAS